MSELVERLIGSFVEPPTSLHPLAEIVEQRLQQSYSVQEFLSKLPENPPVSGLRVMSVTEHEAKCACPFSAKDHESLSYLHSEVQFSVRLSDERCSVLPF